MNAVGETRERGRFVVLEGIDGAGKSLQVARLAARLGCAGHSVVATREPTDGSFGREYREWARGALERTPAEVLELFLADRDEHVQKLVLPALDQGSIVLCDRYVASTRAYQTAAGIDREVLRARLRERPTPRPDLTLWLRLPVEVALRRLSRQRERFERLEFLQRVDDEYARMHAEAEAGDPDGWPLRVIDADRPLEQVEQALWEEIERLLQPAASSSSTALRRGDKL